MAGPSSTSNDRSGERSTRSDLNDLKNKLILALLAIILGGGGAAGYMQVNPPRPDPFTGKQGKELEQRVRILESKQVIDDSHVRNSESGYRRIRVLELKIERLDLRLEVLEKQLQASNLRLEKVLEKLDNFKTPAR